MKKLSLLIGAFLFGGFLNAQCVASASASKTSVTCNECITLTAQGNTGTSVFREDFDNGSPTGWAFTQAGDYSNPCSPGGVNGTPHVWMGSTSVNPRDMETVAFDLSLGGTICFDMLYATQGGPSPCEGPDLPSEGVYLQYSINGGLTWVTIQYHDPLGGNDPTLTNWNNYCYPIPAAAQTINTKIRWHQDAVSGADYDHWGIDNVEINLNDPLLDVTWLHDNFSYGPGNTGGQHPNLHCPNSDTSYIVRVTNGTLTCYDTIDVKVNIPVLTLNVTPQDTAICEGECFQINATTNVLIDSARVKKFENKQPEAIDETGGGIGNVFSSVEVDLNVQGLNMQNVQLNSIKEVCITGLWAYRSTLFQTLDINNVTVELECPSGGIITLVPNGVTNGGGGPGYPDSYINTCFTPTSANNIGAATNPYTGTYASQDPFNNLAGCTANGIWKLRMSESAVFANLLGELEGFSITFCDDSIAYPGIATWNHGTWMNNSTILNPIVCPLRDTSYVLTLTDSNNCVSLSDTVNVTIAPVPDAGRDSSYTTCLPTPTDLFNYLGGTPAGGGIWLDPTNAIVNMPITPGTDPNGTYQYIVTNIAGCNDTAEVVLGTGGVVPTQLLGNDTNICSNTSIQLNVAVPGATYQWSTGAITSFITVNAPGSYWVNATGGLGCVLTDTIDITVTIAPFAGDDGTLFTCGDDPVDLFTELQNNPDAGGTWYNSSGGQVNMPTLPSPGTYKYVVVNGNCTDTSEVVVTSDAVVADFIYNPYENIFYDETEVFFQQTSTNANYFEWFVEGTSQSFGATYTHVFDSVDFYTICLVAFNNNCFDTVCEEIEVIERVGIFVPNTFTPDSDGKNDGFAPVVAGVITDYEFRIFNRWGQLIFYSTQPNQAWDGEHNGTKVKQGAYIWKLDYKTVGGSGKKKAVGHVNVIR